jgi:hypothetical protein
VCEDSLRHDIPMRFSFQNHEMTWAFRFGGMWRVPLCHKQMVGEGGERYTILDLQIYAVTTFDVYSRFKNVYYGKFVCVCV